MTKQKKEEFIKRTRTNKVYDLRNVKSNYNYDMSAAITIGKLVDMAEKNEIVNNKNNRNDRLWTNVDASNLIAWMFIPYDKCPPLIITAYSRISETLLNVMDGANKKKILELFKNNKIVLDLSNLHFSELRIAHRIKIDLYEELHKKTFDELPKSLQNRFLERIIFLNVFKNCTDEWAAEMMVTHNTSVRASSAERRRFTREKSFTKMIDDIIEKYEFFKYLDAGHSSKKRFLDAEIIERNLLWLIYGYDAKVTSNSMKILQLALDGEINDIKSRKKLPENFVTIAEKYLRAIDTSLSFINDVFFHLSDIYELSEEDAHNDRIITGFNYQNAGYFAFLAQYVTVNKYNVRKFAEGVKSILDEIHQLRKDNKKEHPLINGTPGIKIGEMYERIYKEPMN
jgi:hypothetical protein